MTKSQNLTVSTFNVNGIRAAHRRGLLDWLAQDAPDVLLLQEVRAPADITASLLGPQWKTFTYPSKIKGRAGVTVALNQDLVADGDEPEVRFGLSQGREEELVDSGRWIEVDLFCGAPITLVSAYFHSGQLGTEKQVFKMEHLRLIDRRLSQLQQLAETDARHVLVAGDFNIVRSQLDIKNWKGNYNKSSGVLDEEIAYLDRWVQEGWVDVTRHLVGDQQGPYTWWSWRGKAFDNDAGWRIDYQYVTPGLALKARDVQVVRAPAYDQRLSDHAPLIVRYRF